MSGGGRQAPRFRDHPQWPRMPGTYGLQTIDHFIFWINIEKLRSCSKYFSEFDSDSLSQQGSMVVHYRSCDLEFALALTIEKELPLALLKNRDNYELLLCLALLCRFVQEFQFDDASLKVRYHVITALDSRPPRISHLNAMLVATRLRDGELAVKCLKQYARHRCTFEGPSDGELPVKCREYDTHRQIFYTFEDSSEILCGFGGSRDSPMALPFSGTFDICLLFPKWATFAIGKAHGNAAVATKHGGDEARRQSLVKGFKTVFDSIQSHERFEE